jgi:hypothetical protein
MDFVVEDGTGLTTATSYVSTQEADEYLSLRPNYAAWDAAENVEELLMWATRLLDQRATWYGNKQVNESSLRWPRYGVNDRDGIAIPYDEVPLAVKHATIEIAYHLLTQNVDPSAPIATAGEIKRVKADVVEVEYFEGTARATTNYFPVGINDILRGLGSISTGTGSKFGRILRA